MIASNRCLSLPLFASMDGLNFAFLEHGRIKRLCCSGEESSRSHFECGTACLVKHLISNAALLMFELHVVCYRHVC